MLKKIKEFFLGVDLEPNQIWVFRYRANPFAPEMIVTYKILELKDGFARVHVKHERTNSSGVLKVDSYESVAAIGHIKNLYVFEGYDERSV